MDESFLSDANVIRASRNFICIRLATYEDRDEADYLRRVFTGRSGELENTVFAMMNPAADEFLVRPGRSPHFAFRSAAEMADEMAKISKRFPGKADVSASELPVPQMKTLRLALNVASCDGIPLVVALLSADEPTPDVDGRTGHTSTLRASSISQLAYEESLAGRFHYYVTSDATELEDVQGFEGQPAIYLIQPDAYGTKGVVKYHWPRDADLSAVATDLGGFANDMTKVVKFHRRHVTQGREAGRIWKTEIPVTDPQALRAQRSGGTR